jgi:hypothetical protein
MHSTATSRRERKKGKAGEEQEEKSNTSESGTEPGDDVSDTEYYVGTFHLTHYL